MATISNSIATVKNYVKDESNLYSVFRSASLTSDLETPMVHFIGAKTMSYPVFPKSTEDMPDYNPATGYTRESATLVRREVTVSQDKGYQNAIDQLDLMDSGTTAVAYINNNVRQKDVPTVDKYRLAQLKAGAATANIVAAEAATGGTALTLYDNAVKALIDAEFPVEGTIMYCSTAYYNAIKDSTRVIRPIASGETNVSRKVEMLDGNTKIVVVPATRMPASTQFILVNPKAVICGTKHSVTKVIEDPEDFDGILINRRLVHDLIVMEDRKDGIYVLTINPNHSGGSGK